MTSSSSHSGPVAIEPASTATHTRIGLSLSGGGFRAAAFHLGVLKRLEELGILHRVEILSTVSGGSITGALYALKCATDGDGSPGSFPVDSLIGAVLPFVQANLRSEALFGTPLRVLRCALSFVTTRISRIGLMAEELDASLFGGASVAALPQWIVINATNLRTAKAWKFYCDAMGDFAVGASSKTQAVRVAEAVAASAAYPGLTDSFSLRGDWADFRADLLQKGRWERPDDVRPGEVSRWRARFGKSSGPVEFPLVDGGIYDNEGVNSLRGARVTHAIVSSVTPPEDDSDRGFGLGRYLRIVNVMSDRLGAVSRQHAHEMTHGAHPTSTRQELIACAAELRKAVALPECPPEVAERNEIIAGHLETLAAVGSPPRGHQYRASAQILLHRDDVARNRYATSTDGPLDIPPQFRGLQPEIVAELSRLRTDLDALAIEDAELLMAQGYIQVDGMVKLTMPEFFSDRAGSGGLYGEDLAPSWERALATIRTANANSRSVTLRLDGARERSGLLGTVPNLRDRILYRANLFLVAAAALLALLGSVRATGALFRWIAGT